MTAIDYNDLDVARALVGDRVPSKSALPAVWWLTTDPDQIDAYDRWEVDYNAHLERVRALADSIGLELTDTYISTFAKSSTILGFRVPARMEYRRPGDPDYLPVPQGWRIDSKQGRLVPSRKTKADRESQANKDFAAISDVPNVRNYVTGLPDSIYLEDRDFGGTMYAVNFRRGESCLWAYSGGDPDRQSGSERLARGD